MCMCECGEICDEYVCVYEGSAMCMWGCLHCVCGEVCDVYVGGLQCVCVYVGVSAMCMCVYVGLFYSASFYVGVDLQYIYLL